MDATKGAAGGRVTGASKGGSEAHRKAMAYFDKKLQENPKSLRANHHQAAMLLREGKVDDGMAHYATAAMAAPNDILVRNDYAVALSKAGQKRDGVEVMRSALMIDHDNPGLRNNMAALLSRKGDYSEAMVRGGDRCSTTLLEASHNIVD